MQMHEQIVTESSSLSNSGYNLLHSTLRNFYFDPTDRLEMLKLLGNMGFDLHLPTDPKEQRNLKRQSPSSLAMRHSYLFSIWKKLLSHLGLDFKSFIRAEFKANSGLNDAGWTEETLLRLFEVEYEPRYLGLDSGWGLCTANGCRRGIYPEEPWWLWLQETIRNPRDPSAQPDRLRLDSQTNTWNGRYQQLEAIPRASMNFDLELDMNRTVCEPLCLPCSGNDHEIGDNKWERLEQGICIAWPSLCEPCEQEAKRKQADLERKRREEGYDGDDDDEYGDSMFLLNLDKVLVLDSTSANGQ